MLVECGFVRATASDGAEFTFTPSFSRIASLGSPAEIVSLFVGLHGLEAGRHAPYILACLCDQEDPTPLIGWYDQDGWHQGQMPVIEQIVIARHLMQHGIVGKAKPGSGEGQFSETFDASEYIAAARVHLGLSSSDAEGLSMTEFQKMFEMKFPEAGEKKRDVPTRDEYEAAMKAIKERKHG